MSSKQLVTVANLNGESNVFTVEQEIGDFVILSHPLAPQALIKKLKGETNTVQAMPKSAYERCLEFAVTSKSYFDFERKAEIDCLCVSFVINRKFTNRLKHLLVRLMGVPARIHFQNSIKIAIDYINKNKALLDEYHNRIYHSRKYYPIFTGATIPDDVRQIETVFNLAGFLLAQVNTK